MTRISERKGKTVRMDKAAKELVRAVWANAKDIRLPDDLFPAEETADREEFYRSAVALHQVMCLPLTTAGLMEIPGFNVTESVIAEAFRLALQSQFQSLDVAVEAGAIPLEDAMAVKAQTAMHIIEWLGSEVALRRPEAMTKQ